MELVFRWIKIGLAKTIMGVQQRSGGMAHRLRSGHRFFREPRATRRVDAGGGRDYAKNPMVELE
jgi:hypothetical protein